jgi:hypothetical protein
MINSIYELLQTLLNKDLRGNLTPTEFNLIAKQVQEEIFRGYFEDEARDKYKEKRATSGKGFANLAFNQRQRIEEFAAKATLAYNAPNFTLPADLYMIKDHGIDYNGTVIDEIEGQYVGFAQGSLLAPSTSFPTYEQVGGVISVNPATIIDTVTCRYIRKPLDPKWTYTVVSSKELFNAAANDYQDFELHTSEYSNIAIRMASYFGLNLKEEQVINYAEMAKDKKQAVEEQ